MNHFCNAKFYTRERKKGSTKLTKSMVNTVLLTDLRFLPKTKKFCTPKSHRCYSTVSISNPVVSLLPFLPYFTFIKSRIFQHCRNEPKQALSHMNPGVFLCGYGCITTIFIPCHIVIRVKRWRCYYWATDSCRLSN